MKAPAFKGILPLAVFIMSLVSWQIGYGFFRADSEKLDPDLADTIKKNKRDDRLLIFILFAKQDSWAEFDKLSPGFGKEEWRNRAIASLKNLSDTTANGFRAWVHKNQLGSDISFARKFWLVNGTEASSTVRAIEKIALRPEVARIYLRTEKPSDFVKKDKKWARLNVVRPWPEKTWKGSFLSEGKEISWNLKMIRADHVWRQGYTGRGVVVAVLDSGMNYTHPDIKDNLWINQGEIPENGKDDDQNGYVDDYLGWNFAEENQDIGDDFFHGTIVGGLIAGDGTGGIITGVAPQATLMILKTYAYDRTRKYGARFLWQAFQYDKWIALQYALDNGAQVANLSFDYQPSEKPLFAPWRCVLANASHCGLTVVAGAGNSRSWLKDPNQITPPANVPEVIAVGATAENDKIDRVSSRGPVSWENIGPFYDFPLPNGLIKPDLCAPIGRCPYISFSSNGYDYLSGEGGTSSSAPHVAGTAALMLEKNPDLMPWEIKRRLEETSVEGGVPGKDNYYGWGRVDAFEAVNYGSGPNVRLMGWKINDGKDPAALPGKPLDIQLDFLVSACPLSSARILINSPDKDVRVEEQEKLIVFPTPISNGGTFSARIHGSVAETCATGKKIILTFFLNAEKGRKFHFELPIFIGPSDTLVVDDDGEGENEKPVMEGLDHARRYYHVLNTRQADLDEERISRYKHIIWITGEEFHNTLNSREQAFLRNFLDKGGHLLLLGDNVGDDLGKTDFYKDILHAQVIKETLSGNYSKVEYKVYGKEGDPLSRRMVLPIFIHYKQYDLIRPLEGADDPFRGESDESYMGFVRREGKYKLLYTSFGMEAIENLEARAGLLDRVLEWFEN